MHIQNEYKGSFCELHKIGQKVLISSHQYCYRKYLVQVLSIFYYYFWIYYNNFGYIYIVSFMFIIYPLHSLYIHYCETIRFFLHSESIFFFYGG